MVGFNWREALEEYHDSSGDLRLNGYEHATAEITNSLNDMLRQAATFDELKKELTAFVTDRQAFLAILDRAFDHKTGEYHL